MSGMTVRVGINGFGRIGRNFFRAAKKAGADVDIVAFNDLMAPETGAHLLKYDSTHGRLGIPVSGNGNTVPVGDDSFQVFSERDPKALPWTALGVDFAIAP